MNNKLCMLERLLFLNGPLDPPLHFKSSLLIIRLNIIKSYANSYCLGNNDKKRISVYVDPCTCGS